MEMKKVGVIGCGLMGRGICEVSARAGYDVVVSEVNQQLLEQGLAAINTSLTTAVRREKATEADKTATLARIRGTLNTEDFEDCDLVVEAATENLELKKSIFAHLDKICLKHTILATNTSCLSVIDMAAVTQRQDKVLGMHFFNPVPVMRLLELVKTMPLATRHLMLPGLLANQWAKQWLPLRISPASLLIGCSCPSFWRL